MTWTHLDELDAIEMPDGFVWRPVRRHFDIRAFGVNAYTATGVGGQIVEEHSEASLGHEEIYLVVRGRARFTIGGGERERSGRRVSFLRDPPPRRGAGARPQGAPPLPPTRQPGRDHPGRVQAA